MDIRSDRQKGLSYVELGKKYHMDPRTAKRYADSPTKPEYTRKGYVVSTRTPDRGKDWNEHLQQIRQSRERGR